jgi:hypothetical protein
MERKLEEDWRREISCLEVVVKSRRDDRSLDKGGGCQEEKTEVNSRARQ